MTPIKAVIFDLGGTLLHYHDPGSEPDRPFRQVTQAGIGAIFERLTELGYSLPLGQEIGPVVDRHIGQAYRSLVKDLRGGSVETPVRAALSELGFAPDEDQWADLRGYFYRAIDRIVSPREGLQPTLAVLKDGGYKLGLLSNTFWAADLHDRHLGEYGLLDYLPVRVYTSETAHIKPHPSLFRLVLGKLDAAPGESVYVGDRPDVDVAGAQGAGMRGILIRSPYMRADLNHVVPDAVIDELPGLIPALERLQAE